MRVGMLSPQTVVTLAKVRRFAGKGVLFGVHCGLGGWEGAEGKSSERVRVGDEVEAVRRDVKSV